MFCVVFIVWIVRAVCVCFVCVCVVGICCVCGVNLFGGLCVCCLRFVLCDVFGLCLCLCVTSVVCFWILCAVYGLY